MHTVRDAKQFLTKAFRSAGLETVDTDARLLLMLATGLNHVDIISGANITLSTLTIDKIKSLAVRRISGEPVDHILGYKEFYGRRFKVTKDVLSPRPETEMIVDEALTFIGSRSGVRILDLGTGSGAIIISIMAETSFAIGTAVDVSEAALKIARENAQTYNVSDQIEFIKGSWFDPLEEQYDLIISNPPYINSSDMNLLQTEVKEFDPFLALSGGTDGLDAYRSIISQAQTYLTSGRKIILEIGYDQASPVSILLKETGFLNIIVKKDLAGLDRLVIADRPH